MADSKRDFDWKEFLIEIFAWWRGNTWGTRLWVARHGVLVGTDEFGNRYYRARPGSKPGPNGYERRMVVYANGYAEPSTIPAGWHGWMHYRTDVPPTEEAYEPRPWQKPHEPNLTGTAYAYRPEGSLLNAGERPRVTGDYDAWSPE
ncbi:MAG TPA: NADH:ubiquinone oxidoreductase subunit NDUFA12 [Alphaproteobacteria bacterium]|nr:NADH:ubiquinone oxidoreductase subunit NDUFA12 [Alphaproteobacteria bacterium]